MSGFVLDCSVSMSWWFKDETNALAEAALAQLQHAGALVPALYFLKTDDALLVGERRGRLSAEDCRVAIGLLQELPLTVDTMPAGRSLARVMELARQWDLSVHDATYLELAMREGLPLATLDRALLAAAEKAGVPLLQIS